MDIYNKIKAGDYYNKMPLPLGNVPDKVAKMQAYWEEDKRLREAFKRDAIEYAGLTGNPKAERAFEIAKEERRDYREVVDLLDTLASLIT